MAKNLKLNIKNTQLAEALKLGKLKKPSASTKKKKAPEEAVSPPEVERGGLPPKEPESTLLQQGEKVAEEQGPALKKGAESIPAAPQPLAPHKPAEAAKPTPAAPAAPLKKEPPPYRPSFLRNERAQRPQPAPPPAKEVQPKAEEPLVKKKAPLELEEDKQKKKFSGVKEYRDLKPQKKVEASRSFDSRDRQGLRDSDSERWRKRRPLK